MLSLAIRLFNIHHIQPLGVIKAYDRVMTYLCLRAQSIQKSNPSYPHTNFAAD